MRRDAELIGRYADLLGEDDGLEDVVRALDSLYSQGEPPARVAVEIERELWARGVALARDGDAGVGDAGERLNAYRAGPGGGTKGPAVMAMTRRRISTLAAGAAAVVVVGLMAVLLHGFGLGATGPGSGGNTPTPSAQDVFAQEGGVEITAELTCLDSAPHCDPGAAQGQVVSILTQRLSYGLNVHELVVRPQGATGIVIDIPGSAQTAAQALPMLDVGGFAVLDTGGTQLDPGTSVSGQTCASGCTAGQYPVAFTGADLDMASVQVAADRQTGQPVILFAFAGQAQARFAQFTQARIGQYLTIAIDNRVVESAVIQSAIDGATEVTGVGTAQEAYTLAAYMKSGALPAALKVVSQRTVAPGGHPTPFATPCPTPSPFWQPCTPTPTPGVGQSIAAQLVMLGPKAEYVETVMTATGVDSNGMPIHSASQFLVNTDVYVVVSLRNITAGQPHTISVQWYLQGQSVQPGGGAMSRTINQDSSMYFSLRYPTPGPGTAKIYFDRPANDTSNGAAYLAATINFDIAMPGTPTPAPGPTPTPGQ